MSCHGFNFLGPRVNCLPGVVRGPQLTLLEFCILLRHVLKLLALQCNTVFDGVHAQELPLRYQKQISRCLKEVYDLRVSHIHRYLWPTLWVRPATGMSLISPQYRVLPAPWKSSMLQTSVTSVAWFDACGARSTIAVPRSLLGCHLALSPLQGQVLDLCPYLGLSLEISSRVRGKRAVGLVRSELVM